MGEEHLNIVLFGESDDLVVQLVNVVHQLAPRSLSVGADWDDFVAGLRQGPDIVILHLEAFFEVDPDIVTRFAALFAAIEIPVVVAMPIETNLDYRTEIITCFDGIIEPPITPELFLSALDLVRSGLPTSEPLPLDEALSAVFADNIPSLEAPPSEQPPPDELAHPVDTDEYVSSFVTLTPEIVEISNAQPWVPVDVFEIVEDDVPSRAKTKEVPAFSVTELRLERTETGPFAAVKGGEDIQTAQAEQEPDVWVMEPHLERTETGPFAAAVSRQDSIPPRELLASQPPVESQVVRPKQTSGVSGGLRTTSPLRLLFEFHILGSTGYLDLEMERVTRHLALDRGQPGVKLAYPLNPTERRKVMSSLLWRSGTFRFAAGTLKRKDFQALGETHQFIYQVVHEQLTLSDVSTLLGPSLKRYPIVTNRAEENAVTLNPLDGVPGFLALCGCETLESVVAKTMAHVEVTLKNAYFCLLTDLIWLSDDKNNPPVVVDYGDWEDPPPVKESKPPIAEKETAKRLAEKPEAPDKSSNEEEETRKLLDDALAQLKNTSAHTFFGLQQGCGERAAETRFYDLVKKYHPDNFSKSSFREMRMLAEKVFRSVQEAYSQIQATERGATQKGTSSPQEEKQPSESPKNTGSHKAAQTSDKNEPRAGLFDRDDRFSGSVVGKIAAGEDPWGPQFTPASGFKQAVQLLKAGSLEEAKDLFQFSSEKAPDNTTYQAHVYYCQYLMKPKQPEKALKRLNDILEQGENEHAALFVGNIFSAEGEEDIAATYYKQVLRINPRNAEAASRLRLYNMRHKKGKSGKIFGVDLGQLFSKREKKKKKGDK